MLAPKARSYSPGFLRSLTMMVVLSAVALACVLAFVYVRTILDGTKMGTVTYEAPRSAVQVEEFFSLPGTPATYIFFGDIMLGRNVENIMREKGGDYPFLGMHDIIARAKSQLGTRPNEPLSIIGNLEGPILTNHVQTPSLGFQFSFPTSVTSALRNAGFTHLSLANNHSKDWGPEGELETTQHLRAAHITAMIHASSTIVGKIQIITADDVMRTVNASQLCAQIDPELFSILFIHWGGEYGRTPNGRQYEIASALKTCGIDAIIGHHPHVTQTISAGQASDPMFFYSLGNFIFDQYFSNDVKRGLVVGLRLVGNEAKFVTLPVYSERTNPRLMTATEFDESQPCERTECTFVKMR